MGICEGRVVIITGSGRGIGRGHALEFARQGAKVVVNDLGGGRDGGGASAGPAQQVVDEIVAAGGEAVANTDDISTWDGAGRLIAQAVGTFGGLDVLVNNAGIGETSGTDTSEMERIFTTRMSEAMSPEGVQTHMDVTRELADADWDMMIKVHLYGTFHCTREALKLMEHGGAIVNMSSVVGLQGTPGIPHYAAAKSGILGFTRSVAQEVGSRGIRVNAICPGYIDTPMTQVIPEILRQLVKAQTPLGRLGSTEDVARVALFLASDDAAFITGQWISPNGGLVVQ